MTHELTHLDLFSGIGGFALAAGWAGFRTVGFSEVEPYACRVLEHRWPGVPNIGDVRTTANFAQFRGVTVLTGGFPCQPWSAAGKRGGTGDDRHLWPAMLSVIEVARPTWIIGENVPGLDHMGQLDACYDDLEGLGYECQPFEIPACAVDAPHLRERLWIVAHRNGYGRRRLLRQAGRGTNGAQQRPDIDRKGVGERRSGTARETLAHAARIQQGRQEQWAERERVGPGRESVVDPDPASQRRGRPRHAITARSAEATGVGEEQYRGLCISQLERSRLCGGRWLPEPSVGRVANGVPNRSHRLKGLGNAIVPQVAAPFFEWIAQIETQELTQ